jgi:hypothetical protein
MPLEGLLQVINDLRTAGAYSKAEIRRAFEDIYSGTVTSEAQIDENGREYILDKDLRSVATTYGDVLTDEEADQMIKECKPDNLGRIFFSEYEAMLTDDTL